MKTRKGLASTGIILIFSLMLIAGCGSGGNSTSGNGNWGNGGINNLDTNTTYPIDSNVQTTRERTIIPLSATGLQKQELQNIAAYDIYGYGTWTYGAGINPEPRSDIMPASFDYTKVSQRKKLLNFFTMSDIHIGDKESPSQMIYLQYVYYPVPIPGMGNYPWTFETSIYSPVMMYTTFVLDAAMQTVNALHRQNPVDFVISLGDAANNTQFNELRWYIDVIDGKNITPSSGTHLGADTIDYQMPYKAAGLNKSIPWFQTLGNHDHFFIGSFIVDNTQRPLRENYIGNTPLDMGDVMLNTANIIEHTYYMGVIDGSTPYGNIFGAGPVADYATPPVITADPDRRSLLRTEWISEFFNTSSYPVGHGFNLVDPTQGPGFACYSFLPKSNVPLKMIVLDDTQSETDGSTDIHGHGFLDEARWTWLKKELDDGQANNQLMIIAAHIPIAVQPYGSKMEWWVEPQNACTIQELIAELQAHPNLLMWIAGHRHVNTVKAFISLDRAHPENGFWQVETPSLRDFTQQMREFEIYVNSDNNISIVAIDVDPAVKEGTPAAKSRKYAVAAQQIIQNNLSPNFPGADPNVPGQTDPPTIPDPTILTEGPASVYNATLYKYLTPKMRAIMAQLH